MKRMLLDLQDECWTTTRRHPSNVAEAVELVQELLQLTDNTVDDVPLSEVPVAAGGDVTALADELDKAKARIPELEFVEIVTVCRHEDVLEVITRQHAEDVEVWKGTCAKNANSLILSM